MQNSIRYKISDDVHKLHLSENKDKNDKSLVWIRSHIPTMVDILESPDEYRCVKVKIYMPNEQTIVGYTSLDWIDLKIDEDVFDGRFNRS